jgi:hypothetical protein
MSIVTNVLEKLGAIGAIKPRIVLLESGLTGMLVGITRVHIVAEKAWHSQANAQDFQRRELARRTFNESMAKIPAAR